MTGYLTAIFLMTIITLFTRAAPFLFFAKRQVPPLLVYLQHYVPPVVMCLLVLASYKDIAFSRAPYGLPALLGGLCTALLHLWKRNVLLSIAGGTALFMVLTRLL